MKNTLIKIFTVTGLSAFLILGGGCARGNIAMNKAIFGKPGTVALVWNSKTETALYSRIGAEGLADMVINETLAGNLKERLQTMELQPLTEELYLKKYSSGFEAKGIKATSIKLSLTKEQLKVPTQSASQRLAPYDFRSFKTSMGVDYVAYLDVDYFGATQSYWGFVPTGDPQGNSAINIYLIDTKTNEIIAEHHTKKIAKSLSKSDESNDYKGLRDAVRDSLQQSLEEAYAEFFQK
jgi:hypothetical protein